ncbi:MAG: hypothetical protein IKQ18_06865 [Clostridia bacterium]|nr:hypothetical protein [Clostridia bacterium]
MSDVIVAFGDSYDDAVKWLKNNGWNNYAQADLNKNSSSVFDKDRAVVLGYKTTYNVNEAITDLALMNMEGGYSYTSYDSLMSKKRDEIKLFALDFSKALDEYRINYKAGEKKAVAAYNLLNEFYDDDTGKNLGSLLLNPLKEEMLQSEYESLSTDGKKEHADFTTMMLQGNSLAVIAVETIVGMAADTSDSTWLERLSALGPDGLVNKYTEEKGLTMKQAASEIALDYSEIADRLLSMWEKLQEAIEVYESTDLTPESSGDEINSYFDKHQNIDFKDWLYVLSFYDKLAGMKYGEDETLLDLFKYSTEEMSDEEYVQLCSIASVLTEGQKCTLGFNSLAQLINYGVIGNDEETWDKVNTEALEIADNTSENAGSGAGSAEAISVYNGIDRSLFKGDIALTSDAKRKEAKSNSSFYDGSIYGVNLVKLRNILFGAGIGCAVASLGINKIVYPIVKARIAPLLTSARGGGIALESIGADALEGVGTRITTSAGTWTKIAKGLNIACVVMCTAGLVVTVADLIKYYNGDFTPVPDTIVDEVPIENTYETKYVFYKVAQCNRTEKYGKNTTLENDNDLHADLGKVWLSLYYTKDKTAGKPIVDDFVVGKSNNMSGYKALHLFGEASPVNLSDPRWCYTDELVDMFKAKGTVPIYVYYGVDNTASLVSSTFSTGTMALTVGAGILAGAGVGVLTGNLVKKRKKKKTVSEQ